MDDHPVETTLYSLSNAAPQPPQRRSDNRFLSLLRVGTLIVNDSRELCLIRNMSVGGMMIRAYSRVSAGTRLAVELKEGEPLSGQAVWAKDGLVGINFDEQIDILSLIAPGEDGPPPRMPRIEIDRTAWVRDGASVARTKAVNISQGGICIESGAELAPSANVVVTLTGLAPIPGVVRWRHENSYGVAFNHVLPLGDLVAWLQAQQPKEPRRAAG